MASSKTMALRIPTILISPMVLLGAMDSFTSAILMPPMAHMALMRLVVSKAPMALMVVVVGS